MVKMITRLGLIGLLAWGGWYLWSETNDKNTNDNFVKIEETQNPAKNEEDLSFKITKGNTKKTISPKIKEEILKPAPIVMAEETQKNEENPIIIVETVTDKVSVNPTKNQINTKNLTVYFYDYGINLSSGEIFAGDITIRAVNNGRLSHDLTLKNEEEEISLGRIAPGETKFFDTSLQKGLVKVFSNIRIDQEKNMSQDLQVR